MVEVPEVRACLRAAYEPTEPDRKPLHKSRSLREAITRLGYEAEKLREVAERHRPFRETLSDVVERMP